MNILDFHVHLNVSRPGFAWERVLAAARRHGITRVVALGDVLRHGARPTPEQVRRINDDTLAAVRDWPGLVAGLCFLNPLHPPAFLREEIARCRVGLEGGLRGIKLECATSARDERVDPVAEEAGRRNVPLLHHAWDTRTMGALQGDVVQTSPADIAALARRFPRTRIVMAHLAGVGCIGVLEVKPLPNVWVDTSGGQPFAGFVAYAVRHLGAGRVLFGSDATGRDFGAQLGRVTGAAISETARRRILWENARNLLAGWEGVRE